MSKNKKIILSILTILILVIAASFAYMGKFDIDLSNKMNVIFHAKEIDNAILDTESLNINLTIDPYNMTEDDSGSYIAADTGTLNVSLDANTTAVGVTCTYDISFIYDSSTDKYTNKTAGTFKEFTLQVVGPEVGNNEFMSEDDFPSADMVVVKGAKISNSKKGNPSVHNWTINSRFYNLAYNQTDLINKTYKGHFNVNNVNCYQNEVLNQININVTEAPYLDSSANYSLSNLSGIDSSNISWDNINRMISIKNGVNDGASAALTNEDTLVNGTLLSEVIISSVGTSGNGFLTKLTVNGSEQYRYQGNNPDNYVSFNNELYRIIGYVPVCLEVNPITEDTTINGIEYKQGEAQCTKWENRVKLIRYNSIGVYSYDIVEKERANWTDTNIQKLLNTCFLGKKEGCDKYCYAVNSENKRTCNFKIIGINPNDKYGKMIEEVYYNYTVITSEMAGKSILDLNSEEYFDIEILKQVSEKAKIGLIYASDWGYAFNNYNRGLFFTSVRTFADKNWLFSNSMWTMSPTSGARGLRLVTWGGLDGSYNYIETGQHIKPVLYLKSSVVTTSGDGTIENPYTLYV